MDVFAVMFLACISLIFGVILTLTVQYYIVYVYLKKSPIGKPYLHKNLLDYSLPKAIKKQLECEESGDKSKGCGLPVSLMLQFLFHELRHSESIKRWLYKKLSLELDELLTKTTIGKFFDSISIKDMHLGDQFPDIKDITVENVKLDKKEEHLEAVSLGLNIDYTGNFLLSVDAKMKFGKTAYLSIKVKRISGLARLQFSRQPYTHWSFSFFNDPILELAVESHFQGRQLQSNITNLIVNQIKKAIKRKHTLPNYKIRYKPFFVKTDPSQLDTDDNEVVPQGQLEVSFVEVSRLSLPPGAQNIYCTIAIDTIPWISIHQKDNDDSVYIMTVELTMTKVRQAQLGVIFKQEQGLVIVDSVAPNSCAFKSGLRPGDVVVSVENKAVTTVPQVAKFIKTIAGINITLKVERQVENYVFKHKHQEEPSVKPPPVIPTHVEDKTSQCQTVNNLDVDDTELTQTEQDTFVIVDSVKKEEQRKRTVPKIMPSNENMVKLAQTIGSFSLRKRKASVSERPSSGSSERNTPTSSIPGTPQHNVLRQAVQIPQAVIKKNISLCELPEIVRTDIDNLGTEVSSQNEVFKGRELAAFPVLRFNDDYQFNLREGLKYLNINVWATLNDEKDLLLGYTNIPLSHVLNECCNSVLGHYIRCYSFLPPGNVVPTNATHPLLSHSGFEHVFCYGDVLLSFVWTHDDDVELKRKSSSVNLLENCQTKSLDLENGGASSKHDFIRTQFHRTTHCDFCSKKIWLKDAVQCRQCGLCCHKKCIVKCQTSTGCNQMDRTSIKSDVSVSDVIIQPEITMTEVADDAETKVNCGNLKRVNSVNNLAIPGSHFISSTSRSLPQTPQRTPSRKQSLIALNPFSVCPEVLDEIQKNPSEATENVNRLLEQVMACPSDESLMDNAKETGRQLYIGMPHEERVEKINLMMAELKKTLDMVTMEHMELSKQMGTEDSEVEKARLAFLMGQADAKVHGLSVLMLHYCSSLQHSQDKIV